MSCVLRGYDLWIETPNPILGSRSQPPSGQYSQDRGSLPSPVTCLPPQSLPGGPRSWVLLLPAPRADLSSASRSRLSRPDATRGSSSWDLCCSGLPTATSPPPPPLASTPLDAAILTAALGTIPAVHWLLPRQPRATPLPIGPALFRAIFVRGPVF